MEALFSLEEDSFGLWHLINNYTASKTGFLPVLRGQYSQFAGHKCDLCLLLWDVTCMQTSTCEWVSRSAWWRGWTLPWCGRGAEDWHRGVTGWVMWVGRSKPVGHGPSAVLHERCCVLWSLGSDGIVPWMKRRRRLRLRQCWQWRGMLRACGGSGSCRHTRIRNNKYNVLTEPNTLCLDVLPVLIVLLITPLD